jgi:hypothetical protein
VATTSVTLTGTLDPRGSETSYAFAFGPTVAYGRRTAVTIVPLGTASGPVSVELTGLTPGTTYHYQLVAANAFGTALGGDRTFTTVRPTKGVVNPSAVSAAVEAVRDSRAPYRYTFRGRVELPENLAPATACSGTVRITIRQGNKTRGRGDAAVGSDCRYSKRVTAKGVTGRRGTLRATARFLGNDVLKPRSAKARTVRFGPR